MTASVPIVQHTTRMSALPWVLIGGCTAWIAWTLGTGADDVLHDAEFAAVALVGIGLTAVGVIGRLRADWAVVGGLALLTGLAWLVQLLRFSGASVPWTLSLVAPGIHVALIAHLALAYPRGETTVGGRRLLAAIYAVMLAGPVAIAAFTRDPASQGYEGYPDNLVLLGTDTGVWESLSAAVVAGQALLAPALAWLVARRWVQAGAGARRDLVPASIAGATAVLLLAGPFLADGLGARSILWVQTPWDLLRWAVLAVFMLVPVTLAAGMLGARLAHSGVADLVLDLDRSPGSDALRGALVRTLRDPSLTLVVWDPATDAFRDPAGEVVGLPPDGSRRVATLLERHGRRVGALIHDRALRGDPALIGAAASAVRIALENDRLHSELRVQLAEVRASRARIVSAGDVARRRLERDLHDGAQQKLVSQTFALAEAERRAAGDPELLEALAAVRALTRETLADVRAVAHGLHPPILRESGLVAALEVLADTAPVPVLIDARPPGRLPDAVEVAVYFTASEALANVAKHARATSASITVATAGDAVSIEIADDGAGGADPSRGSGLRGLGDRVAALDGHLELVSPMGGGTRLRARIPVDAGRPRPA